MPQPKKRNPLNPLDLVIVSRERLQEVFDDAVSRGRMTRDDATDLVAELVRRGVATTSEALSDIEQLLGRSREQLTVPVDRARRVAGIGSSFPIAGYDDLSANEVTGRLDRLSPAELRKVRDYERRNANRKTVLQAIESKLD
jgi:hypothetical protein